MADIQAYTYDENYIYERPIIVDADNIPPNCTATEPPDGLWRGQYQPDKDEWIETATADDIQQIILTMTRSVSE
ncbi:hypothetical protein [Bacillus velezensis]|uniref:hypothetical protein n=1 Tax=Bacillus velezensis TaxID=492670 RepID=UPI003EBCDBBE